MVETHLCKLRGTSDTFVRGLAAVGKLTKIVIRRAELIASLVHDIRREEMICIDYFLGAQDFAYERGRDEAAARGLAAVGKLTKIVEVEAQRPSQRRTAS